MDLVIYHTKNILLRVNCSYHTGGVLFISKPLSPFINYLKFKLQTKTVYYWGKKNEDSGNLNLQGEQ